MRLSDTGYSQLEGGHVQPPRSQAPVISGIAQTAWRDTGSVTSCSEEHAALLRQLFETEDGRALVAPVQRYVESCTGVPIVRPHRTGRRMLSAVW